MDCVILDRSSEYAEIYSSVLVLNVKQSFCSFLSPGFDPADSL